MARLLHWFFIVTLFCGAFLWTEAIAQPSYNLNCLLQYYHDWRDGGYDIATVGSNAYLACGNEGVHVLDISDLNSMRDVAHLADIHATTLAAQGNTLYLGTNLDGVYKVDVSDPAHPVVESSLRMADCTIHNLRIEGQYLCVCASSPSGAGLSFIPIGTEGSFNPVWTSHNIEWAYDIDIRDHTAYVGEDNRLIVYDVSDMTSPVALDSIQFGYQENVLGVAVSGNYAYLANADAGFRTVDLATRETVSRITDLDPNVPTDEDYPIDVQLVGNTAYVHYNIMDCPLAIIDVTDPVHPVIQSNYYPPDNISKFMVEGNYAYLAALTSGLRVVDITNPLQPVDAYNFDDCDQDLKVAGFAGDIGYIQQQHRLVAVDLSDPRQPRERGTLAFDIPPLSYSEVECIHRVEIDGTVGYCFNGRTIYSLDLSDPDHLTILDHIAIPGEGWNFGFIYHSPRIYVQADTGFVVVDASDPQHLVRDGQASPVTYSLARDGYLFQFPQRSMLLCAYENVQTPQWIGPYPTLSTYGNYRTAKIIGDRLYLADAFKVYIYSVSQPGQPAVFTVVDSTLWNNYINDLDVADGVAYIGIENGGIEAYDVRDPQAVTRIGYIGTPAHVQSVFARGSIVYAAEKSYLGIYEFTGMLAGGTAHNGIPQACVLEPNYPNPFNPTTTIGFDLPAAGNVSLAVFNTLGQKVTTLVEGFRAAGHYQVQWDGTNSASGVYFYRLQTGQTVLNRKMTLVH